VGEARGDERQEVIALVEVHCTAVKGSGVGESRGDEGQEVVIPVEVYGPAVTLGGGVVEGEGGAVVVVVVLVEHDGA
jgi:hypothetical protein